MSSKNVLAHSSQASGLDIFKNALKSKLNLGNFIDDKTSIYEAEYKTNLKQEGQLRRKLKFKVQGGGDCDGSHSSDNS